MIHDAAGIEAPAQEAAEVTRLLQDGDGAFEGVAVCGARIGVRRGGSAGVKPRS
jgi:hypothetical protein